MTKTHANILNAGQTKNLTAAIYDLTEVGAKQALYGIVRALAQRPSFNTNEFEEMIDDARRYVATTNKR